MSWPSLGACQPALEAASRGKADCVSVYGAIGTPGLLLVRPRASKDVNHGLHAGDCRPCHDGVAQVDVQRRGLGD